MHNLQRGEHGDEGTLSVADLIRDVRIAQTRMSRTNPHRALFAKCETALIDVSFQLHKASRRKSSPIETSYPAAPEMP